LHFRIYGCQVESDRLIPGVSDDPAGPIDLVITFEEARASLGLGDQSVYHSNSLTVRRTNGAYFFAYADATEFLVGEQGNFVVVSSPKGALLADICTYLVGPVLGFLLRLRGVVCLHASTVVIGRRAVAFCGPPGAGKSTTAAVLAQRGYSVLSEDLAALDDSTESFWVRPGYPRINLWPESAAALRGSADLLPLITPNWGKRYLPLDIAKAQFHSTPAPLAAIYVLGDRREQLDPQIHPLQSVEALMALASNTYTPYLLDPAMRAREFELLSRLVKHVPVRRVLPPADICNIGRLSDGLLKDFESIS
jgi:hypothetical protein